VPVRAERVNLRAHRLYVKIDMRKQVDLRYYCRRRTGENAGILEGLVIPLGNGEQHDLEVLAQVVGGGADQIANIFDEKDICLQPALFELGADKSRVQVAGASGNNLPCRNTEPPEPIGISLRGNVPFNGGESVGPRHCGNGSLEKSRLP